MDAIVKTKNKKFYYQTYVITLVNRPHLFQYTKLLHFTLGAWKQCFIYVIILNISKSFSTK